MEYANIEAPMFDSQNYTFWNKRMKTVLQAHGFDVWKAAVDGYTTPTILIVVVLVILLLSVLTGIKILMKKKLLKGKINIKRETREETKGNSSRKVSTQRRIVPHQTRRIRIVTVIQKEYSSR